MEQIIEFETAKLAKEKGFDYPTLFWYFENYLAGQKYILVDYVGVGQLGEVKEYKNHNDGTYILNRYSAPTQSILQKWLREVHKINIIVDVVDNSKQYYYEYSVVNHKIREYNDEDLTDQAVRIFNWKDKFNTYEEALEEGLIQGLKLVDNVEV